MVLHNYFNHKSKEFKFLVFLNMFATLLAALIYWREDSVQEQISFYHVLVWQIVIWLPWAFAFTLFEKVVGKFQYSRFRKVVLYALCAFWILMHFAWFFYICSGYSPYLGMPATKYGVYPYFFIFWTIVDIGLMWFILEKIEKTQVEGHLSESTIFELSRGDKKYFCEPKQIHWLSADNYYTKLYTDQGKFLIRRSLKNFYKKLPHSDFRRIHRSTVININFVSGLVRVKNNGLEVILKDGTKRRVSRNYSKEIRTFFQERSM